MPDTHVPELRWSDASDGRRLLFAGNQTEPVAWGERDARGWQFHVALPGATLVSSRSLDDRTDAEAFTLSVVEGWFKEIHA